jgi:serine protease AprX
VAAGVLLDHKELMRLHPLRLLAVLAALTLGTLLPSVARASDPDSGLVGDDPKIANALEQVADERAEEAPVRVILIGRDPAESAPDGVEVDVANELEIVEGVSATVTAGDLDRLADDPDVAFIALDSRVVPTGAPLLFPTLSTLYPRVGGVPSAWALGWSGAGVGIAVIDTGVANLPDFGGRLVQVQLPDSGSTGDDKYGHGTFVAGLAAGRSSDGRYVGVAPGATVYGINVSNPNGSVYTGDVLKGLDWVLAHARENNIRVLNISLSETTPSSYLTSILDAAVERLWRAGITVVASAGNRGAVGGAVDFAPANDPFAITVGALDANGTAAYGDDLLAPFTSAGVTVNNISKPELLASGRLVGSALPTGSTLAGRAPSSNWIEPGYARISGTSFAAPQVAGAAAVLLEQHPTWTPDQIKGFLTKKSRSISGNGMVALDLDKAVTSTDLPKPANERLQPTFYGLDPSTIDLTTASWNTASWNTASWNTASWNTASWNTASWNTASWNTASWNFDSWG